MQNHFWIKIKNIFSFLFFIIIYKIIRFSSQNIKQKTLLLIRLDSIGDYLLVRNFFQSVKSSTKFSGYKITLLGNELWKDLTETFDSSAFNEMIWLNRKKYLNNIFYKYRLLKLIYKKGFEIVVDTTYSREILFGDSIIKTSCAKERIGSTGSLDSYVKWKRKLTSDSYYTKLLTSSKDNLFEFYRNREFYSKLLQEEINLPSPSLDVSEINFNLPSKNEYILIFPGAADVKRKWNPNNFLLLIGKLAEKYSFDFIIAGSKQDDSLAQKILSGTNNKNVFNLTGRTSLPQLAKLIACAKLLISNETSAIHFAASVKTKFVCISNGNHFGRFNPYPAEMNLNCVFLYPSEIENNLSGPQSLEEKYRFGSELNINSITIESVFKAAEKLL